MKKIAIAICLLGVCGAVYAQRDSRAEATLPLPMAAPGSFYRWEDVKNL